MDADLRNLLPRSHQFDVRVGDGAELKAHVTETQSALVALKAFAQKPFEHFKTKVGVSSKAVDIMVHDPRQDLYEAIKAVDASTVIEPTAMWPPERTSIMMVLPKNSRLGSQQTIQAAEDVAYTRIYMEVGPEIDGKRTVRVMNVPGLRPPKVKFPDTFEVYKNDFDTLTLCIVPNESAACAQIRAAAANPVAGVNPDGEIPVPHVDPRAAPAAPALGAGVADNNVNPLPPPRADPPAGTDIASALFNLINARKSLDGDEVFDSSSNNQQARQPPSYPSTLSRARARTNPTPPMPPPTATRHQRTRLRPHRKSPPNAAHQRYQPLPQTATRCLTKTSSRQSEPSAPTRKPPTIFFRL